MDPLIAQDSTLLRAREHIYQGYITGEYNHWKSGLSILNTLNNRFRGKNSTVLYELAVAQYGLIGYHLANDQEDKVNLLIKQCERNGNKLLDFKETAAAAHALLGGLMGIKMDISPAKALFIGPQSMTHIEKSTKLGPQNPAAWLETANMRLHSPALFGGSTDEAIKCYKKSINYFNQQTDKERRCWLYLHAQAWLGKAYEKKGQYQQAITTYENALAYEANFGWIKDELLPAAQKRMR